MMIASLKRKSEVCSCFHYISLIHPAYSYSQGQSQQPLGIKQFLNEIEDWNTIQILAVLKWAIAYDTQTKI